MCAHTSKRLFNATIKDKGRTFYSYESRQDDGTAHSVIMRLKRSPPPSPATSPRRAKCPQGKGERMAR